ncbi:hypothetical protein IPC725_29995 [Pseudomonas aeruginosa]|nr:hypothetical protein IPC725_29995 [Pseudomonas aeruginosa]
MALRRVVGNLLGGVLSGDASDSRRRTGGLHGLSLAGLVMALLASGVGHARTVFPVESRPIGGDESFFRLAETSESPVEYMGRLPPRNPRIEEGRFDEESGLLRYKVRNDDVEPGRDFFFLAKILDFDWSYYLYHDLYAASFRFLSVRAVAVLDSGDRQAA